VPVAYLVNADAMLLEYRIEAALELGVMIAQEDRVLGGMVGQKTERLSGTFRRADLGRLGAHPGDLHPSAGNMNEKEDENFDHTTECDHLLREEVAGVERRRMPLRKVSPSSPRPRGRGRIEATSATHPSVATLKERLSPQDRFAGSGRGKPCHLKNPVLRYLGGREQALFRLNREHFLLPDQIELAGPLAG
jgi:hypothetical protein